MIHLIYEVWMRFRIRVWMRDLAIFEKVECECDCNGVRRLKNY